MSDGVIVGWLDTDIAALLERKPKAFAGFAYWLVTSIDSSVDLRQNASVRAIVERHPNCTFLGDGLVIPGTIGAAVARESALFSGFGEVWFFTDEPLVARAKDLTIVSPLNLESDPVPPLLGSWMKQSRCELGLGDGIGTNYVSSSEATARLVESAASFSS